MEELNKRFELQPDGSMKMYVKQKQDLKITHSGQMATIGSQENDVVNTIAKENVNTLLLYLKSQKGQLEAGIQQAEQQLEQLKEIDEKAMPKKTVEAIHKYLAEKKKKLNKKTQEELIHLSRYINDVNRKKASIKGIEQMKNNLGAVTKEIEMLEAAMKGGKENEQKNS